MKPPPICLLSATSVPAFLPKNTAFLTRSHGVFTFALRFGPPRRLVSSLRVWCSSEDPRAKTASSQNSSLNGDVKLDPQPGNEVLNFEMRSPLVPVNFISVPKLGLSDQAFFLVTFIACTTSVAFTSLVVAAVPTLLAMRRAAISLSKLADTAREELPSTMAAIRLSGMEISDLTLELSDLSQEIAEGVNKSAQAVQAAEAGVRQIGSLARQQTMSMIEERASLPVISIQPVVAGAAKKTSRAVGQATKTLLNIINSTSSRSGGAGEDGNPMDRIQS